MEENPGKTGQASQNIPSAGNPTPVFNPSTNVDTQLTVQKRCTRCLTVGINPNCYILWEGMEFCNITCVAKFQRSQAVDFRCICCSNFIKLAAFGKFYIRIQGKVFRFFCCAQCMDYYITITKTCCYCQRIINKNPPSTAVSSFSRLFNRNVCFCSMFCCNYFHNITNGPETAVGAGTPCYVCKDRKPITVVLKHDGAMTYFCEKRCLTAYSIVKLRTGTGQCMLCQKYFSQPIIEKYMIHYENIPLYFCSTACRHIYMIKDGRNVSCAVCLHQRCHYGMIRMFSKAFPHLNAYLCSINCFNLYQNSQILVSGLLQDIQVRPILRRNAANTQSTRQFAKYQKYSTKVVLQGNVATMCVLQRSDQDAGLHPTMVNKVTQTEDQIESTQVLLPTPVPIHVPLPMFVFCFLCSPRLPFCSPSVPVIQPVTKRSVGVNTEMQRNAPNDPYEAELLSIAEVIVNHNTKKDHLVKEATLITEDETSDADEIDRAFKKKRGEDLVRSKTILMYMLGVDAFQEWIKTRASRTANNASKTDIILQMSPQELNNALSLFIREIQNPDGCQYSPDTVYYLCLGVQYYLNENGHEDSIFFDGFYTRFCNTFNTLAEKFHNESRMVVTRIEEELLWEAKQLGCHSPQVLLNTLIFFNMKYYNRCSLEEHLDLSFYQILKTWSNEDTSKVTALTYYSKNSKGAVHAYVQHANEENPARCPVKLYEFYLSKCPESVKTSYGSFYLQPEQHCASDSPLWYTNVALPTEELVKALNRFKMVKEINYAFIANRQK